MRLIDREIETTATALISSDISQLPIDDFEEAEEYLHDILGTKKIAKIILLRRSGGKIIYSNANADFVPDELPLGAGWDTIHQGSHTIRLLSVPVERKQVLQVGLFLDREESAWKMLDLRFLGYCFLIIAGILGISYLLAGQLLSPLRHLALYLDHVTNQMENANPEFHTAKGILPISTDPDEFSKLVSSVNRLTEKINDSSSTFKSWTALMAHELKTPMTILRNNLEAKKDQSALDEIERMGSLINAFLEWSSLENESKGPKDIHAVTLNSTLKNYVKRNPHIPPERVEIQEMTSVTVFASPTHVEQLCSNLIENALKYSPSNEKIVILVEEKSLKVIDAGPGLPATVLSKLGQPFNFVKKEGVKGTGLGLALVCTLCKKYGWKFSVNQKNGQTLAQVIFS